MIEGLNNQVLRNLWLVIHWICNIISEDNPLQHVEINVTLMSNLLHPCLIVRKQEMRNDVPEEIITKGQAKDENLIQFM